MIKYKKRSAGILLHISSLPNKYGIGTLGKSAYEWIDLLADCGISYWQVLPLVQTSYGDSPYQSAYSGSGNPYFIDFDILVKEGLLKESELSVCRNTKSKIDYAFLYEIDAGEETAIKGKWKQGPKYELFQTVENKLGKLNIIAEDLGSLDKGVYRLMDETGYPGMKVMEFAFDGNKKNPYLPKNIKENSVCYTGTHDNDTLLGYINKLKGGEYKIFKDSLERTLKEGGIKYFPENKIEMAKVVMLLVMSSLAYLTVIPIQDILLLGSRARMNTPSTSEGNWQFKLQRLPNRKELFDFCDLVNSCERRP